MDDAESLSHTRWECKYHVVFIPKLRRKTLCANLRRHLREVFRNLAEQKESRIEEGHLLPNHVHMLISIPPKHPVSQVIGLIKGKSAIHLARVYGDQNQSFDYDNPFAGGAGIQQKDILFVSGEIEKDRTIRGSKGKQVSWLSSRTPGLDWPGHSLPGKIKSEMEMSLLYI